MNDDMRDLFGDNVVKGLRQQIAEQLRSDVLIGKIGPGTILRQEELVARFGVSRTPIREALMQLANEGMLEASTYAGVKVRQQAPRHIQVFLTSLRRTIEVYALQLCFDSLNAADFELWDRILDKCRKACEDRDYPAIAGYEIAFHRSVLNCSADPTLIAIWGLILSQVTNYFREAHRMYDDPLDIYREHAAIVATFRSGNERASLKLYSKLIGGAMIIPIHGIRNSGVDYASDRPYAPKNKVGGRRTQATKSAPTR